MKAFRPFSAHHPVLLAFRRAIPSARHLQLTRTFRTANHALPHSSPLLRLLGRHPLFRHRPRHRPYTTTPPRLPPPEPASLSARLRKLSREYGWSALGVYVLLSALDFPFCFIAVRMLGTERIGHWEGVVVEWFWWGVAAVVPERMGKLGEVVGEGEGEGKTEEYAVIGPGEVAVGVPVGSGAGIDHGVQEAEERNKREDASIWTQLALAYAIHKSFIFIRVPLTAAVTPKVVRVLRGWGWDIGKRKGKGAVGVVEKSVKKD